MNSPRSLFLRTFLAFLVLTAVVAVVTVLQGEIGRTQGRILGTSATIALASVCGLIGAAARERGQGAWFAPLTIVLAALACAAVVTAIWTEREDDTAMRVIATVGVGALSAALGLLLWLPRLAPRVRPFQVAAAVAIGALMAHIDIVVWWRPEGEWPGRLAAVLSIAVALATLAIPILAKVAPPPRTESSPALTLRSLGGDLWADDEGRRYRVRREPDAGGEVDVDR